MTRYTSHSIILHWLSAGLLIFLLITGTFILSNIPNTIEKLGSLKIHMIFGVVTTLLSFIRIIMILKSPKPEALLMHPWRARLMKANHIAVYGVIMAIGVSGFVLAQNASLGEIIFFGADKALYTSFKDFDIGIAHGFLTKVLFFLIITHVLGVLSYTLSHQHAIMKRMWF